MIKTGRLALLSQTSNCEKRNLEQQLITWGNVVTARAAVAAVTQDRVVRERVNSSVRANQNSTADVAIDLVLRDRNA